MYCGVVLSIHQWFCNGHDDKVVKVHLYTYSKFQEYGGVDCSVSGAHVA